MESTTETRNLAQNILDYLMENPERHDQEHYVHLGDLFEESAAAQVTEENLCQTTMCVAGTAVFLTRPLKEFRTFVDGGWEGEAGRLLGLDDRESDSLFYANNECAIDLLRAIADGNQSKFDELVKSPEYERI